MPNQSPQNQNSPTPVAGSDANQINVPSANFSPNPDLPPLPDFMSKDNISSVPAPSPESPKVSDVSPVPPPLPPMVTKSKKNFGRGKIIATAIGVFLLIAGVGAGILITQQSQIYQPRAVSSDCIDDIAGTVNDSGQTCVHGGVGCNGTDNNCQAPHWTTCANPAGKGNAYCNAGGGGGCTGTGCWCNCGFTGHEEQNCGKKTGNANGRCFTPVVCKVCVTTIPSPTPAATAECQKVKAFDSTWTQFTDSQLASLKVNDLVNFCVGGTASSGTFDKAAFSINGMLKPETTTKRPGSNDYCQSYTITSNDNAVNVKAKIHHLTVGWVGENF